MDVPEAIKRLRAFGLVVRAEAGPSLYGVADPVPPEAGYRFSLSVCRTANGWVVRCSEADTEVEVSDLADAISRACRAFLAYRELHSPRVYGDQFARFESDEPLVALETALVREGWITRNETLDGLGLTFVHGAYFRITFDAERRMVLVVVNPARTGGWRLTVKCYRQAGVPGSSDRVPIRGHRADGTPIPDRTAARLAYQVARVLHAALTIVASNIRWSVHADPVSGVYSNEPLSPA